MRSMNVILGVGVVVLLSLVSGANARAQEFPAGGAPAKPAATGKHTVAAQLNQQLSFVEKEFVDAAQAMPEEKYSFVPMNEFPSSDFKGVRNFAAQVMHVATANYQLYGAIIPDDPAAAAARSSGVPRQKPRTRSCNIFVTPSHSRIRPSIRSMPKTCSCQSGERRISLPGRRSNLPPSVALTKATFTANWLNTCARMASFRQPLPTNRHGEAAEPAALLQGNDWGVPL